MATGGDASEWQIAVASNCLVAWAVGETVYVNEGEETSSHLLVSVENDVEDKTSRAKSRGSVSASALAWVGLEWLLVGGTDGAIRVLRRRQSVGWEVWRAFALLDPVDWLSVCTRGVWCRSGKDLAELRIEEGCFGLLRMLPADAMAAAVLPEARCVVVGTKPAVALLTFGAHRQASASTIIRGVMGAVWGAFFKPEEAAKASMVTRRVDNCDVPVATAEAATLPASASFAIFDDERRGTSLAISNCGRLAAIGDDIGRVLLVDTKVCRLLRLWKGIRGAECAFVENSRRLVMLAPRRALIRIFRMRFGGVVAALQLKGASLMSWKLATSCEGRVFVCAKKGNEAPTCAALDAADDEEDCSRQPAVYYATGADAKAARTLRASVRARDVAGALAALAGIADASARAKALDEAARSRDGDGSSVLEALVGVSREDEDAALRQRAVAVTDVLEAHAKLALLYDEASRNSVAEPTTTATTEAVAWLEAAAAVEEDTTDIKAGVDAMAACVIREALSRYGQITDALAMDIAAESAGTQSRRAGGRWCTVATLHRGVLVWKAVCSGADDRGAWRRALEASFESAFYEEAERSTDAIVCDRALTEAAAEAAEALLGPLRSRDVFGLRELTAAACLLGLTPRERCRMCWSWFASLSASQARLAIEGPAVRRWLKDDVVGGGEAPVDAVAAIAPILEGRGNTQRPAHALALTQAALEVIEKTAELVEAKTYGDVSVDAWGATALSAAIDELRVASLLQLGPPRRVDATVSNLDAGIVLVADVVAADAAAAPPDASPEAILDDILGDRKTDLGLALARAVTLHRHRGWIHATFADLDPDALRCSHALAIAQNNGSFARVSLVAEELVRIFSRASHLRPLVVACAADVWRRVAAPALLDAMHSPLADIRAVNEGNDEDEVQNTPTLVVDTFATLVDLFKDADRFGILEPANPRGVDALLNCGGSRFASGRKDDAATTWPSRHLGTRLSKAWDSYCASPVCKPRLVQLDALRQCLRLALAAEDVPLACVAGLFGLGERSADILLELETPPRDDVAAFADLARATLQDAVNDPNLAKTLRLANAKRNVPAFMDASTLQ